jgi:hypothetical protein
MPGFISKSSTSVTRWPGAASALLADVRSVKVSVLVWPASALGVAPARVSTLPAVRRLA